MMEVLLRKMEEDRSKAPLAHKTRSRSGEFLRQCAVIRKKVWAGGCDSWSSASGSIGNAGSGTCGGTRVSGGGGGFGGESNLADSGSVAGSFAEQIEGNGASVRFNEGVFPVIKERGEASGTKKVVKSAKGSENFVPIYRDSVKIGTEKRGMEKGKNFIVGIGDCKKSRNSREVSKRKQDRGGMGVDESDDEIQFVCMTEGKSSEDSQNLVPIHGHSKEVGKTKKGKDFAVVGGDFKKTQKFSKLLKRKKNLSVDDEEMDDEVQFLGTTHVGQVAEGNDITENCAVDSSCSTAAEDSSDSGDSDDSEFSDEVDYESCSDLEDSSCSTFNSDSSSSCDDFEDEDESRICRYGKEKEEFGNFGTVGNLGRKGEEKIDDDEVVFIGKSYSCNYGSPRKDENDSGMRKEGSDEEGGGDGEETRDKGIFKRGRGRPRKDCAVNELNSSSSLDGKGKKRSVEEGDGEETRDEDILKRGRGRSRKDCVIDELNSSSCLDGMGKKRSVEKGDGEETIDEGVLKRGRPRKDCAVDELNSSSSGLDGRGNKRSVEAGLKRIRFDGLDLDIFFDCEKDENEVPRSMAERIRLRRVSASKKSVSVHAKSKKKEEELGTSDCPFTFTDEELDSPSGHEDVADGDGRTGTGDDGNDVSKAGDEELESSSGDDNDTHVSGDETGTHVSEDGNDRNDPCKAGSEDQRKVGRPAKRRRVDSARRVSVDKILADSIWEGNALLQNLVSSGVAVPDEEEETLPVKFSFRFEETKPQKSYSDIEAEKLFAEMDFALAACEIGAKDSSMIDEEDSITEETDPATCCRQGKHQLVLDEEIGLKCKYCSWVKLEINYILPSFGKHPLGRQDRKNYFGSTDHLNLDELHFPDSASAHSSGSKGHFHPEGTVWDIIPGIKYSMYPHQREGFEFIWKNLAGGIDLEELKNRRFDGGSGCIISHAPGTGKTRLTIVFLQTYMVLNPTCRPVIIAPKGMLHTWEEEFRKWKVRIPFHNLNKAEFSGLENKSAVSLLRQYGRQAPTQNTIRMVKLFSWKNYPSILGISYSLFMKLAGFSLLADGAEKKGRLKPYPQSEEVRRMLLELPGLLVLDEGHTPRNKESGIWKALSRVGTQRRIILSGTPFQNNFDELYNTLCLARPKFASRITLETRGVSGKKRGKKSHAAKGEWASLTSCIGKDDNDKLDKLRAMINPFVNVHKGTILKESLPGLRDSLVVLHPTDVQKALIKIIQDSRSHFDLEHRVSLISVHPSVLLKCALCPEEEVSVKTHKLEKLKFTPGAGVKTKFLVELIRLCEPLKERVLVFSQYIDPLLFIKEQLMSHFHWTEGTEVLYMDGKLDSNNRQASISLLNDPASGVRVLLASTRACCEGISLIGASRVVLLDVVWNPSIERQAISRAYRLGQKRIVNVYHLITTGTMEEQKYLKQAEKDRLSELVFSSADGGLHASEISCTVSEDEILQEMVQHEKMSKIFDRILHQPKESNFIETFG